MSSVRFIIFQRERDSRPNHTYITMKITENRETSHRQKIAQRRQRKVVITSLCLVHFWRKARKINFAPPCRENIEREPMNSSLPEKNLHITHAPESVASVREIRSDSLCKSLLLSSPSEAENGHPSLSVLRVVLLEHGGVWGCSLIKWTKDIIYIVANWTAVPVYF